ncbi:hypothetical protein MTR62_03015 [Novosphingobium sp. 1949]|uniref:Porin n=1 Tax=Novosphingobium organovorum TaxID=2930092 RepID=A0ABT0BA01_9SPHN|nr:hypothetical protein [Novosphingobium organovorum]MCJ2181683.1 hypothetical protein [Novosphingobium organovorum]
MAGKAEAQAGLPGPADARIGASGAAFDMRALGSGALSGALRARSARLELGAPPEAGDAPIKLRLRYMPQPGGPRFEIGSIGSRKGAMKRQLLHVALDWSF